MSQSANSLQQLETLYLQAVILGKQPAQEAISDLGSLNIYFDLGLKIASKMVAQFCAFHCSFYIIVLVKNLVLVFISFLC